MDVLFQWFCSFNWFFRRQPFKKCSNCSQKRQLWELVFYVSFIVSFHSHYFCKRYDVDIWRYVVPQSRFSNINKVKLVLLHYYFLKESKATIFFTKKKTVCCFSFFFVESTYFRAKRCHKFWKKDFSQQKKDFPCWTDTQEMQGLFFVHEVKSNSRTLERRQSFFWCLNQYLFSFQGDQTEEYFLLFNKLGKGSDLRIVLLLILWRSEWAVGLTFESWFWEFLVTKQKIPQMEMWLD